MSLHLLSLMDSTCRSLALGGPRVVEETAFQMSQAGSLGTTWSLPWECCAARPAFWGTWSSDPTHLLIRLDALHPGRQVSLVGQHLLLLLVSLPFPCFSQLPLPTHQESALTKAEGGCQPPTRRSLGQDCRPGFCVPTCSLFLGPLRSREAFTGRQRPSPHCSLRTAIRAGQDFPWPSLCQAQRLCSYNTLLWCFTERLALICTS